MRQVGRGVCRKLTLGLVIALACAAPASAQSERADKMMAKMMAKALEIAKKDITSRNVEKRRTAAEDLGRFGDAADQVVPLLATALDDIDADVREKAASSLWKLRKASAPAESALRGALTDTSAGVRVKAAGALEAIGVDPEELVAARRSVLTDGGWFDRALAIRDLIGNVDEAELAAPLVQAIRDTPPTVRADDPRDRFSGVAVLEPLTRSGNRGVIAPLMGALAEPGMPHATLVVALEDFDPEPDGWVDALVRLARDPDPRTRKAVASALGIRARRPDGGAGWPDQVLGLLEDPDPGVRQQAVLALGAAGGHAHAAVPAIARIAGQRSDDILRAEAVRALGSIGDASEPFDRAVKAEVAAVAGPVLLSVVDDAGAEESLRQDAMKAYAGLTLEPEVAVRELSRVAGGSYPDWVRIQATRGFWPLGRDAESALPLLERLTGDPDSLVAAAARQAIDGIHRGVAVAPAKQVEAAPGGGAGSASSQAWLRQHKYSFDQDGFRRALVGKDADAVEHYLAAGISASDAGTTGMPPLQAAVMFGCPYGQPTPEETSRIVAALLAAGADPNATDEQGNRALHRASSCDGGIIQQLVAAGADMHAVNGTGMTAFGIVVATNTPAAEAMLAAGYRVTPEEAAQYKEWFTDDPVKRKLLQRAGVK